MDRRAAALSSLNTVVAAPGELWALRYPGQHALHIIEPPAGASVPAAAAMRAAAAAGDSLHVRSATSSVHAPALQELPSVVVASEELDGERGWRMLVSGELVHVRPDLTVGVGRGAARSPGAPGPAARRAQHRHLISCMQSGRWRGAA